MKKFFSLMLATIHSIYRTLQPVNAAHFLEMAKAQGMARVANFFSLPVFLLKEKQSLHVVDSSTGCLRMIGEGTPLVKYLTNLHRFAETFGLHQKKHLSTSFDINTAIARVQEVYNFDCQCIDKVKILLESEAQTQGLQGTVSAVAVDDERNLF